MAASIYRSVGTRWDLISASIIGVMVYGLRDTLWFIMTNQEDLGQESYNRRNANRMKDRLWLAMGGMYVLLVCSTVD